MGREGPDQGRAWAIAIAACGINALLSGISRTTGLLYVALIGTYGASRFQANLPFTTRNVVRCLSGPLVGAIGQRYGAQNVTIIGGIFASLGILLCTFAPDVIWITVLWGGMHGFGVALGNTLFQVVINMYFVKYRATASGLALSGACFGSFTLPVLLEYLLEHEGLSGTFLITGAVVMNVLPAAIMMVEPPWITRPAKEIANSENRKQGSEKGSKSVEVMSVITEETKETLDNSNGVPESNAKNVASSDLPRPRDYSGGSNGVDNRAFVRSRSDLSRKSTTDQVHEDLRHPLRTRAVSIGEVSITLPMPSASAGVQETSLSKALVKMCRDPMFHMISLSLGAFSMLFDPAITVIVDYIIDKGLKEDVAKYLISMLSLGDLLGRLGFGWIVDKDYMSTTKYMMILQVIQGVCFVLMPWFNKFESLMSLMVIYGVTSGAALIMYPILVAKYLQTIQSLSVGCITFLTGIMSFAIPPLIGYFRDNIGSYDGMFHITGGLSVITGFLWLLEPLFIKLRKTEN